MRHFLVLILSLTALPLPAQERILSPERATGFDKVITQCVSLTRAEFANAACDDLLSRIDPMIRAEGLEHIALGRTEWGFGPDVYLRPQDQSSAPVHLTLYLRGAESPAAMNIWLSLYKRTDQGRLVLWEDSGLGSGDNSTIASGLSQGLAAKLEPVFKTLGAYRIR